ncbi:induced myeloid leukemia cell differentiation protein Mcl-1-like [Brachionichthys hirsutus]|uniref:induced myeloid leukemia cell differentiation protein Mcl-1-like n=1 Tax=Brachionichthys hirsutus TaxID=412623 RepID=UPI0036052504
MNISQTETADGSLPDTPELEADGAAGSEQSDALENDTRELIMRFLLEHTGLERPQWRESRALSTMRRVVGGLLEKHRYTFNGMVNTFSLGNRDSDVQLLSNVARLMFSDGIASWGRIVSLVAFGAVVCKAMKEKRRGGNVPLVAGEISSYLLAEQRGWLTENNSWDGFVEYFRVSDLESDVWDVLMTFMKVSAIAAMLAWLIR